MNPMEDRKLPIKVSNLKSNIHVAYYLIRRILLPRQTNLNVIIKKGVVPLCLQTQQFQTNWVEGMLLYMKHYKQTRAIGILYGAIIIKILATFIIDPMG